MDTKKYSINDFLEAKASGVASFSPDGKRISYLNNDTGTSQLYVMDIKSGETVQLTDYEDSISHAVFSPTKDLILFQMASKGDEQSQLYLANALTKEITAVTSDPSVRNDFGAWSEDGTHISFRSNERNGTDFDAYILNVETGEKRYVFSEGGWVAGGAFSPKGTYLIVSRHHSNVHTDLYLCNLVTGETTLITKHDGEEQHGTPRWLPDESAFFVTMDRDREFTGLAKYDLGTRSFTYVLTPEWDIDGVAINVEGTRIAVTINEDGYDRVRMYDTHTFEEIPLTLPSSGLMEGVRFSRDSTQLIFTFVDSIRTQDVWVHDLTSGTTKQLTHSMQAVPAEELVQPELIRFTSFDGLSVPAFVYRPRNGTEGKKLPAIIEIHGGPEAQYRPSFARLTQYYVYSGYTVIAPNVRGSSGYGKSYLALDDVEKRLDSVKDLVALHEHVQTIPFIDGDRLVLSGASYGGFMVLAGLAFYPDLWAGGVDVVGIANFVTFLENTAPYRRALREPEYGSLEKDRAFLEKISPINSVDAIKAPLMVIHGANDPRVPLSEAEQIVEKLRAQGKDVELLVYQDEGHGLAKLKNRLDAYPKVVRFLERILVSS